MRMYVWSIAPSWIAVAHAPNATAARALLLNEGVGFPGDGSCAVRDRAREYIKVNPPSIWMGAHAEFELTDSGLVEELEIAMRVLHNKNDSLRRQLAEALQRLTDIGSINVLPDAPPKNPVTI